MWSPSAISSSRSSTTSSSPSSNFRTTSPRRSSPVRAYPRSFRCRRGAAYVAAKHGVVGLTKAAALDYAASNVRINVLCPGIIDTPMMDRFSGGTAEGRQAVTAQEPVGRMGTPEEIAAAAVWLCSEAAGFVIGTAFVIDGGQTV